MTCSRRLLLHRLAALAGWACGSRAALAAPDSASVCGSAPPPAYPPVDKPAVVQSWLQGGQRDGPAPDCGALRGRDFELLVRLTASFAAPDGIDAMLTRLGAVSTLKTASYWSFTDHKRLMLFQEAYAVDSLSGRRARADFTPAELRSGAELVFVHSDNRSGNLSPYGLRLTQHSADSLTLQVENLADIRMYGLLLVGARESEWSVQIERLGPGRWGYRSLWAQRHLRLGRVAQHRLSHLSRCAAMFDLLAGRQTELELYR